MAVPQRRALQHDASMALESDTRIRTCAGGWKSSWPTDARWLSPKILVVLRSGGRLVVVEAESSPRTGRCRDCSSAMRWAMSVGTAESAAIAETCGSHKALQRDTWQWQDRLVVVAGPAGGSGRTVQCLLADAAVQDSCGSVSWLMRLCKTAVAVRLGRCGGDCLSVITNRLHTVGPSRTFRHLRH